MNWGDTAVKLGSAALSALGSGLSGTEQDDSSKEIRRDQRIKTEVAQQGQYPAEVTKYNLQIDRALAEAGPAYAIPRIINYLTYLAQAIPYGGQQIALGTARAINPFDNPYKRAEQIYTTPSRIGKGFNKAWGNILQGGASAIGNMIKPGNQPGLF